MNSYPLPLPYRVFRNARNVLLAHQLAIGVFSLPAVAQQATPPTRSEGEIIVLSAFEVSAGAAARYQATQATSGGRLSVSLMDTPGSIAVVTSDLLRDVGATRLLDAVKLVPGVTEGITPNGLERVTIRGFQSDFTVTDGFRTGAGQMNLEPALIDRVEVMKGPNAILQPQGTPGGTVNATTKSPSFQTAGSASIEIGQYDSNRAVADYNSVLVPEKVAYRIVLTGQDGDAYWDESYTKRYSVMPSFLFQLGKSTRVVLKGLVSDYEVGTYGGAPLDPSVGTDDEAKILTGMDRKANFRGDEETRQDKRGELSAFLTTRVADKLSIRLAARYLDLYTLAFGTNPALAAGGSVNPRTGKWVGGVVHGAAPTFTPSPAAPVVTTGLARSGGDTRTWNEFLNFQNDYAFEHDFGSVQSTTSAGYAYATSESETVGRTGFRGTVDLLNTRAAANTPVTYGPITQRTFSEADEQQLYAQQQLTLLEKRLVLSGGITRITGSRERDQTLLVPYRGREKIPDKSSNAVSYGVVYKPTSALSLYYGHSENAALTGNFEGVAAGTAPLFAEGIQDEFGIKVSLAEGRVAFTLAYFDITQTQFGVDDPRNYTSPPPVPRLPFLFFDRTAKGWEFSVNAAITQNLSFVGGYYDAKNRDPNDIPFQASPDQAGSAFLRYDLGEGALKGFGVSLGIDYLSRRPGVQASGFTAASTPTALIPVQPSFYVSARTLTSLGLYYAHKAYHFQINVENALDEEYLTGTFTRTGVWVGTPRNVKFSASYRF